MMLPFVTIYTRFSRGFVFTSIFCQAILAFSLSFQFSKAENLFQIFNPNFYCNFDLFYLNDINICMSKFYVCRLFTRMCA
jgi:hypothetical protein